MATPSHITVLGGGPAGLAVGYYARKSALPFTIYEAKDRVGGNAVTLKHGDFFFDSGAHRFHDRDAGITEELEKLLGKEFRKLDVPNQVYYDGKLLDFPFSPLNLIKNIGLFTFIRAAFEVLTSRIKPSGPEKNFREFALHTYGKTIAELFLLNFSEKLWGEPCEKLSSHIAGTRLKGLTLKTFIKEAVLGRSAKTEHLEGSFYYPEGGIGVITDRLAGFCGETNIATRSRITKVLHDRDRISAIEINGEKAISVDEVVSTLPLDLFLRVMDPAPPEEVLTAVEGLRYRNMVLAVLFLDRESVTRDATVYFPDNYFPFTRIYEPRNRSARMSPEGKTSLVVEIPCQREDAFWKMKDDNLLQLVRSQLIRIGWIKEGEIIDTAVKRLDHAYPILETGFKEHLNTVNAFLGGFRNLKLSGRNGKFKYAWVHNMMRYGKTIIDGYASGKGGPHG